MIAELRQRHRVTWIFLAVLVPVIIFAAWRVRRPAAVMDRLPDALREEARP